MNFATINSSAYNVAVRMLGNSASHKDAVILACDIMDLERERFFDTGDEFSIAAAARELERRIGGLSNLESYMACLRVSANR